jgi:hypothetical protein
MPYKISTKIEDKIVSLFALDLNVVAISKKIKADGVADGTNVTVSEASVRRLLYANDLMESRKSKRGTVCVYTPDHAGGPDVPDHNTKAAEISSLSGIIDVDKFIAEANSILAPLEVEHGANGELLGSLRSHLDGLAILAHALSGKDSELTTLKNKQADYQGQIAGLNKQIATWQGHAFRRAEGKPSETSLVERG